MSFFSNDIKAKDVDRREIEQHLQAFYAARGVIQRPEPARFKSLTMRDLSEASWARRTDQ